MLDRDMIGVCPLCQSTEFGPGFNGRMDPKGIGPQCLKCKCAERHRIIRLIYNALRPIPADWRVLQFAPDGSLDSRAFKSFEYSMYGGHNSLDMTDIQAPDGAYDLVVSNHVIEHVDSEERAMRESLRVAGPTGLVHVNAPSPSYRFKTVDWGFADPKVNEHYRDYGSDMGMVLARNIPGVTATAVSGIDPVTFEVDTVFFYSYSEQSIERIVRKLQQARFPCTTFATGST